MRARTALLAALGIAPVSASLLHFSPAAAQPAPQLPPGVVATVDGHPIRKAIIEDRLWRERGDVYTGYFINEAIVAQEAEKRGLSVTPEELQARMAEYRAQFIAAPGRQPRDWEDMVHRYGLKNIEARQKNDLLAMKVGEYEAAHAKLTPEETQHVLDDLERAAHKVRARQVLIGVGPEFGGRPDAQASALAEEVRSKLAAGASWDDVAKQYSDDISTRGRGGDLGFFTRDQMAKPLEDAAFSAKPGDKTIQIVRVPSGYDVLQVTDRKDTPPTEAEKQKALDDTLKRKQSIVRTVNSWFPQVEGSYKIVKSLPY